MEFIRGDTYSFKTLLKFKDNTAITKSDLESLFITCKKNVYTEDIIFQKGLDDVEIDSEGYCHIVFEPKDTEQLEYGTYVFDLEITTKSGYRKTKLFQFEISGETTFHGGDLNGN